MKGIIVYFFESQKVNSQILSINIHKIYLQKKCQIQNICASYCLRPQKIALKLLQEKTTHFTYTSIQHKNITRLTRNKITCHTTTEAWC